MEDKEIWGHIAKHLAGESTAAEEAELAAWINGSEENRRIYMEVRRVWIEKQPEPAPERLKRGKSMVFDRIRQDERGPKVKKLPIHGWWQRNGAIWQVAAALVIMVLGWYGYSRIRHHQETVALKKVENIGKPKAVTLPDGSTVWLNSESSIRFATDFSGKTREVYLEGEAFFDVRRDESKPFIVHAGSISTRVLGTSFNIRAYPGLSDIEVTVSSGKVSVSDSTGVIGELVRDQQIAYQKASGRFKRQLVPAHYANAWKESKLIFEAETFGMVAKILERRYHVAIQFSNKNVENSPVTAQFDSTESVKQILYMVGLVTDSKSEFLDEKHILISSNKDLKNNK